MRLPTPDPRQQQRELASSGVRTGRDALTVVPRIETSRRPRSCWSAPDQHRAEEEQGRNDGLNRPMRQFADQCAGCDGGLVW